jgi:DNA-binding transcriptional LysR family regulator
VVELVTGTTGALIGRVNAFEVEAAFISEPFSAAGLETLPVFEEALVLVTARSWAPVSRPADLRGATLIAFAEGCSYRRLLEEWLGKSGVVAARSLEFSSYQAMIACVAAGTGFAIVPESVLKSLRATADVRQHALPERFRTSRTHLVWRGSPSVALTRLLEMLPVALADVPAAKLAPRAR